MMLQTVRVWDLPTRVFHWVLAASVLASIVTAKIGGNATIWHFRLGYLALTLLAFRVLWGLVGGRWSRFASFVPTPAKLARYLRGQVQRGDYFEVGHSPLGALSVLAMIGVLLAQVATGLVADDEIANTGPLITFVPGWVSTVATRWHKGYGQIIIISLIVLHLAAIAYYRFRKGRRLVSAMVTGDKVLDPVAPNSVDTALTRVLALALVLACAAAVYITVNLAG